MCKTPANNGGFFSKLFQTIFLHSGATTCLLLGEKPFRFSCERRHDLAVSAHASPLLRSHQAIANSATFTSQKKRRYTISAQMADEKKIDIPKTPFTFQQHLPWSPKIDFNSATRLQCLSRVQVHVLENTKRSFIALRPSILLFQLPINL